MKSKERSTRVYFGRALSGISVSSIANQAEYFESVLRRDVQASVLVDPYVEYKNVQCATELSMVDFDLLLLKGSDALVLDMSIPGRSYIGCSCELVYAHMWGIPAVVNVGDTGLENRAWLKYHSAEVVSDLESASRRLPRILESVARRQE
jgi:hypothetical protein